MYHENGPLLSHGGYRHLRSDKVAEAVYDATVVFCRRFIPKSDRKDDQMVQAARSGVCNISEGSGAAATSRRSEMKLTNVARASLNDELLQDYESFLRQNGLRVWHKDSRECRAVRERFQHDLIEDLPAAKDGAVRLSGLVGLAEFVGKAAPELAANAMPSSVHQADYLLRQQLRGLAREFTEKGGFTENRYATRKQARDSAGAPACPDDYGKPMRQRIAKQGKQAGETFSGCSGSPDCKGVRPV